MTGPSVLSGVPRTWWFPGISGYRSQPGKHATYSRFDLDAQPSVLADADGSLDWLRMRPSQTRWAITQDDDGAHTNVQTVEKLRAHVGFQPVSSSLETFIADPSLQASIRSCTGCYLDLGDFAVPVVGANGLFCHFLSDQQWSKHWLVYCGEGVDHGVVVVAEKPYGFNTKGWLEDEVPEVIDPSSCTDVEVCADSFNEFLYRFWIENELYFSVSNGSSIDDPRIARYAQDLRDSE